MLTLVFLYFLDRLSFVNIYPEKISVYTCCPDIIINSGLYHFQKYPCLDNMLCGHLLFMSDYYKKKHKKKNIEEYRVKEKNYTWDQESNFYFATNYSEFQFSYLENKDILLHDL